MKARNVLRPSEWGIALQLVLVATLPAFLMFVVIGVSLYVVGEREVRKALDERGRLIAVALAETGQYGVVSGNTSYLERNVRQFLATDESVSAVEIRDAAGKVLVSVGRRSMTGALLFEHPIGAEAPDVDLFDNSSGPHVSAPSGATMGFRERRVVGVAKVWMSPAPIQAEKRQRLYISTLAVFLTMVLSGTAGLYLAQRLRAPLRSVMGAIRQIRQGDYAVKLRNGSGGELDELQQSIEAMAEGLSVNRQQLEDEVASRTIDLQQAIESVAEADAEKRQIIVRTNSMLEEERQRIANEIHDDLNAALIVMNMKAQHIVTLAAPLAADDRADIEQTARDISATTERLYGAARAIVKRLRPEVMDTLGLVGALEEMVRSYDQVHPNCRFALHVGKAFPDLRGELAIICYRLVQEALSNVVKHSNARNAEVTLDRPGVQPVLLMGVSDNGSGFNTAARAKDRIGLIAMRERVAAAGGSIKIRSVPNEGTNIRFRIPVSDSDFATSGWSPLF